MDLERDGREYARWTVKSTASLPAPPDVRFTLDGVPSAWVATSWEADAVVDPTTGRETRVARLLVAGPDAPGASAHVLALGTHQTRLRITDSPEVIPRDTDDITVG